MIPSFAGMVFHWSRLSLATVYVVLLYLICDCVQIKYDFHHMNDQISPSLFPLIWSGCCWCGNFYIQSISFEIYQQETNYTKAKKNFRTKSIFKGDVYIFGVNLPEIECANAKGNK